MTTTSNDRAANEMFILKENFPAPKQMLLPG